MNNAEYFQITGLSKLNHTVDEADNFSPQTTTLTLEDRRSSIMSIISEGRARRGSVISITSGTSEVVRMTVRTNRQDTLVHCKTVSLLEVKAIHISL